MADLRDEGITYHESTTFVTNNSGSNDFLYVMPPINSSLYFFVPAGDVMSLVSNGDASFLYLIYFCMLVLTIKFLFDCDSNP